MIFNRKGILVLTPSDAELPKGTVHLATCAIQCASMGTHFYQHAIEKRTDGYTLVQATRIESDAETGSTAVIGNGTVVGLKLVTGIFRCDATLHRNTGQGYSILIRYFNLLIAELVASGNEYLGLDEVNAGHHFRHRMFYLYSWIDLNEIYLVVAIYQEFNCTYIVIRCRSGNAQCIVEQLLSGCFR